MGGATGAADASGAKGVAQDLQKRASSLFSTPQPGHFIVSPPWLEKTPPLRSVRNYSIAGMGAGSTGGQPSRRARTQRTGSGRNAALGCRPVT